jgi:hypothetical protein
MELRFVATDADDDRSGEQKLFAAHPSGEEGLGAAHNEEEPDAACLPGEGVQLLKSGVRSDRWFRVYSRQGRALDDERYAGHRRVDDICGCVCRACLRE